MPQDERTITVGPKITKIKLDNIIHDIDLPADATPSIDTLTANAVIIDTDQAQNEPNNNNVLRKDYIYDNFVTRKTAQSNHGSTSVIGEKRFNVGSTDTDNLAIYQADTFLEKKTIIKAGGGDSDINLNNYNIIADINDTKFGRVATFKSTVNIDGLLYTGGQELRFGNDNLRITDNTQNHNINVHFANDYTNFWKPVTLLSNIKISAANDANPPIIQTTFDREGGWVNFGRGATFNSAAEFNNLIFAGGREIRMGGATDDQMFINFTDNTADHNVVLQVLKNAIRTPKALEANGLLYAGGQELRFGGNYLNITDDTDSHNTILHINKDYIDANKVVTLKQGANIDVTPTQAAHAVRKDYVDDNFLGTIDYSTGRKLANIKLWYQQDIVADGTATITLGKTPTEDMQAANKKYVDDTVSTAIENLPEPMIFKGSLGTGGTITSLPTAAKGNEGWTYKVITAGTYAGKAADIGDAFICAKTGSSTYEWVLIPSGDEPDGTVTSIAAGTGLVTNLASNAAITTSGTISLADNYGDTKNPYASKTKKYVLAAPTASNGAPTFRPLVAEDIPALAYLPDDTTFVSTINGKSGAVSLGDTTGLGYLTTAPQAANTDGMKIVVLSSEPSTRYSGYLYIITE